MSPRTPRTGRSAESFSTGSGYILLFVGALGFVPSVARVFAGGDVSDVVICAALALFSAALFALGVVLTRAGRAAEKRAASILAEGEVRTARVVDAQRTGMAEGEVPIFCLTLELDGESGPYKTTTNRLIDSHDVARLLDQEVQVRVAPDNRLDVVIDDGP